jgi:uncharacterized protein YjbJ (UPF0337 family)
MQIAPGAQGHCSGTMPDAERFPGSSWSKGLAVSLNFQRRFAMNWNQVEGNWAQFKGKVQTQWGKLTGDDLDVIDGKRKELAGKIQERYGKAQDEVEREVDDWLARN